MLEANRQPDATYEPAPLGLRIAALAVDGSAFLTAFMIWTVFEWNWDATKPIDATSSSTSVSASTAESQRLLEGVVLEPLWDFALVAYVFLTLVFACRFIVALVFGTTPGRKLTGLWIVKDVEGVPAWRPRLAFRESLSLLFFLLPGINIVWGSFIFLRSFAPGWHERISKTAVVAPL